MAQAAGATLLRGGAFKPRTSPYAFQGLGLAGPRDPRRGPRGDRPADRDRGGRRARRAARRRARRHAADRHPQHGQLRAAAGRRRGREAGAAQARDDGHGRGVADGGRVHRPARQPRRGAVRARHPDLRAAPPATPSTSRRCRSCRRPATCRSSWTRATRPAARTSSSRWPARRIAVGADGVIVDVHPDPESALCDGPRPSSAATCASWRRPSARSRRCSAGSTPATACGPPDTSGQLTSSLGIALLWRVDPPQEAPR